VRAYEFLGEKGKLVKKSLLSNQNRINAFVKKYEAGQPFVPLGGDKPTILLKYDEEVLKQLKLGNIPTAFEMKNGQMIKLSGLEKTIEFGGKPSDYSPTAAEDTALAGLNGIFDKIKGNESQVEVTIGNRKVNVAKFVSTPGTPKSDFHAVDANGDEVAWISHKKGSTHKQFQGYGGMSDKELASVYVEETRGTEIKTEIEEFVKDVKAYAKEEFQMEGLPKGVTVARKIKTDKLRGIAVYGIDFRGSPGRQNVDLIIQGEPGFDENNKLVASGQTHSNGQRLENDYEPVLMAMYKGPDRSNFGVLHTRFTIYQAGGRTVANWI